MLQLRALVEEEDSTWSRVKERFNGMSGLGNICLAIPFKCAEVKAQVS